jgi:hypothetical protein
MGTSYAARGSGTNWNGAAATKATALKAAQPVLSWVRQDGPVGAAGDCLARNGLDRLSVGRFEHVELDARLVPDGA